MAVNLPSDGSKDVNVIIEELSGFANIFASEFNKADIHDRVLCFQLIKEGQRETNVDSEGEDDDELNMSNMEPRNSGRVLKTFENEMDGPDGN